MILPPLLVVQKRALNDVCLRAEVLITIQTIRIVTLLENKYYNFKGLNLTFETLDGLIKHNGPVHNLSKFNNIKEKFLKKINFYKVSLEAQITSISDDIIIV